MTAHHQTIVLRATRGWKAVDVGELWAHRELLAIFAWRDLKVRYRQTFLGALWVMGQPLVSMLIFTLLFGRVAKLQSETAVPYPVFVLSGTIMWNFVAATIQHAGNSLIGSSFLISKVYFPRLVIPLANGLTNLVDFGVAALLLIPVMAWYSVLPGVEIVLLPLVVLVAVLFAVGVGLWVAALNVEYRDVRIVIPWILQIAMFVAPVVYPLEALPQKYRWLAQLNPVSGIIEGFRATLFGTPVAAGALAWSVIAALLVFAGGAFYFRRMERLFADML
ncbi:MAG TPA: ABC transporter permease [Thermoanaerobaculia bacterium]|nr:ABC transporter permease [Thermoanaerobaculia bacterium]